ncbi:MAG TPA: Hsp20 family protein [Sphingomonas sp.]|nr:Hsp20 family protein [Sphingomonas sp.]
MRTFDFTPYRRTTVGFDRLFDLLEDSMRANSADNYPPVNIEKLGEDQYRITLAVAGFSQGELEVIGQQNLLVVRGRKPDNADEGKQYLHHGIGTRPFERRFELADFVKVSAADLKDGLLIIDLVREIPEAMKPRKIEIGGSNVQQVDGGQKQLEGTRRAA